MYVIDYQRKKEDEEKQQMLTSDSDNRTDDLKLLNEHINSTENREIVQNIQHLLLSMRRSTALFDLLEVASQLFQYRKLNTRFQFFIFYKFKEQNLKYLHHYAIMG